MKQFYTDKDIEELFNNGVKSLRADDDVVLTDLAFEKARKLGMILEADVPPAAPVRPYLSEAKPLQATPGVDPESINVPPLPLGEVAKHTVGDRGEGRGAALEKRIREKVASQLGNQIEPQLLDAILKRTLRVMGMK